MIQVAKRRAQVMRHRITEGFQLFIYLFQLFRALFEMRHRLADAFADCGAS